MAKPQNEHAQNSGAHLFQCGEATGTHKRGCGAAADMRIIREIIPIPLGEAWNSSAAQPHVLRLVKREIFSPTGLLAPAFSTYTQDAAKPHKG